MFSSAFYDSCREAWLRVRSGVSPGTYREEHLKVTTLVKTAAVVSALCFAVSCSTISRMLTETDPMERPGADTITGGNRIPLPPSVEEFDRGRDFE